MAEGGKYIAVAGNIGTGKTSLVQFVCSHFRLEPLWEPNEANPYLKDFYRDMPRWAFHSQVFFLAEKFRLHQGLERTRRKRSVVLDRTIYEDAEIFARNLYLTRRMRKRDYQTYWSLYQNIARTLQPPDLLIYLRAGLRAIRQRIRLRGRPEEQRIPPSYLRRLNRLYEDWLGDYHHCPVLVLQTDNVDYATDLVDRIDILQRIKAHL